VLVVHAGNRIDGPDRARARFPSDREPAVADRLGELLDVLAPEGVITSAAAGADLLIVEAAEKRQIPVHLVLPFPRARFCAVSVRDQGPRWVSAFEHAVERADRASTLVELDLEPDVDGLLAGNQALLDRASALARTGLLVVAVRPAGGEVPPSVTDDFVRRAGDAGLFVIEIDPRGHRTGR
jgi:ABC-type sugar transport system substrate-binding protein